MLISNETVIGGEGLASRTRAVDNALVDRRLTLRMRVDDDDGGAGGGGSGGSGGSGGGTSTDDGDDGDREILVIGSCWIHRGAAVSTTWSDTDGSD